MKIKKKGIAFFSRSKMAKSKMAASVRKNNIFANNFSTTYYRDTSNMSILMFSVWESHFLHLFLEKNIVKYLCKSYKQRQVDIAVKLRLTLFWLIVFFLLIMLGWLSSSDIWADEELSSLRIFAKHEIQNGRHKLIFWATVETWKYHQTIIFLSGTTIKQILPSFDVVMPKMTRKAMLSKFPSKLHTGTSIYYTCVVSLHITHEYIVSKMSFLLHFTVWPCKWKLYSKTV